MGMPKVVNLRSNTSLEEIQRFNSLFIPEKRLSDLRFLEWKYRLEKPDGDEITRHYGVLNERGEIVGQISAQTMEIWLGGQWHDCQYFADWHSDPACKLVGLELLLYVMRQKPLMLATSGSHLTYSICKQMKFRLLPIDYRYMFVCRPLKAFVACAISSPRLAARHFLTWLNKPFSAVKRPSLEAGFRLVEEKCVDPDLLTDWEKGLARNTVFVKREVRLFSWLLEKFPFSEFRLMILSSRGRPIGYVLLHVRERENGLIEGKIVDLFARDWNGGHLMILFREAAWRLFQSGVHVIHYHASHPTFASLAEGCGFVMVGIQSVIAYGPLAGALSSGETLMHVTYYDHDEAYY